ncbi:MAG: hypothetical protein LQ343_002917 [Gyalolechia ehrenbergii]|nr:MAG: hypothetical protein LQ343_002917 [Gyalolechia ehrenbergii]
MATSTNNPSCLYKILPPSHELPSPPLPNTFILPKTSLDDDSGFIHFSTSSQVPYVLNRFFNNPETSIVWLVKIDYARLTNDGDVRWEEAGKDRSLFAHLYGGEVMGEVVDDIRKVERVDDWSSSLENLNKDGWLKE